MLFGTHTGASRLKQNKTKSLKCFTLCVMNPRYHFFFFEMHLYNTQCEIFALKEWSEVNTISCRLPLCSWPSAFCQHFWCVAGEVYHKPSVCPQPNICRCGGIWMHRYWFRVFLVFKKGADVAWVRHHLIYCTFRGRVWCTVYSM